MGEKVERLSSHDDHYDDCQIQLMVRIEKHQCHSLICAVDSQSQNCQNPHFTSMWAEVELVVQENENVRRSCNNLTTGNFYYKVFWTTKPSTQMVCCLMYAGQQYAQASPFTLSKFQAPKNSTT